MKKQINNFLSGWNDYWFALRPLHALALFRFFTGILIFVYYAFRLPYTDELFSNEAIHIVSPLFYSLPWEQFVFSTPVATLIVLFALTAALSYAVGFFTRTSNGIVLLMMLYLDGIEYSVTPGYYGILLISTFLMLFAPAGQFGSVDFLLWKRGKSRRQIEQRKYGLIWVQRLIVFQIAIVYFSCALHKSIYGYSWYSGETLWQYFVGLDVGMLPFGIFLAKQTWLMPVLGTLTVILQFFLGVMFLTPQYRYIGIVLGALFHFFTLFTFRIPYSFCFTMWVHYLLIAKPEHVQMLVERCADYIKEQKARLIAIKGAS